MLLESQDSWVTTYSTKTVLYTEDQKQLILCISISPATGFNASAGNKTLTSSFLKDKYLIVYSISCSYQGKQGQHQANCHQQFDKKKQGPPQLLSSVWSMLGNWSPALEWHLLADRHSREIRFTKDKVKKSAFTLFTKYLSFPSWLRTGCFFLTT